jgi:predicted MFS family arabinose efflux permease
MLNNYLKYLSGSIYTNAIFTGLAEIIANCVCGYILIRLGLRYMMTIAFTFSTFGALCIIMFDHRPTLVMWFLFVTRMGVGWSVVGAYSGVAILMPT